MNEEIKQPLPKVLALRVQNILKKEVTNVYSTGTKNVVEVLLADSKTVYVDLSTKQIVQAPQSVMDKWGKEDTEKLTGKKAEKPVLIDFPNNDEGDFDSAITRDDLYPKHTPEDPELLDIADTEKKKANKTTLKKSTAKKTSGKKTSK